MIITTYQSCYQQAATALMAELQDHERSLLPDMLPSGAEIAYQSLAYLQQQCADNEGHIYLAIIDDKAVGLLGVYVDEDDVPQLKPEYRAYAYISELVVDPAYRGQGIAQQLIKQAEDYGRELELNTIRLSCLAKNTATCDFYDRLGYEREEIVFSKPL